MIFKTASQTDLMTRAELAFSGLDRDKSGYITVKELRLLSKKMSEKEISALMNKAGAVQIQ